MAAIFAIGTRCMQLVEEEFSSAKVAEIIDSRDRPESIVIAQGDPNEKTTLFFYLHRPILWVDGHPDIEFATRSLGIGRDHYLTREQVAKAWRETKQVFLVIEEKRSRRMGRISRPGHVETDWHLRFSGDFGESIEVRSSGGSERDGKANTQV